MSLRILHIFLQVSDSSPEYHEFALPLLHQHQISACTFFPPLIPVKLRLYAGDGAMLGFRRQLKRAFIEESYDVVHCHAPHVALPYLMTRGARATNDATVYTVHNSYENYRLRNRLMTLSAFAFFKRIVHCSQASFESFPAWFSSLAGKRRCVIRNGMNLEQVDQIVHGDKHQNGSRDSFTIASIGRLVNIKNQMVLLAAFDTIRSEQSRLIIMGEGPMRPVLEQEIARRGLESVVELAGLIPRKEVYERLRRSDLYVSTSRGEGLPISVLEAMACRCPLVLSDIPPHREIAAGIDNLPLILPDDVESFAASIQGYERVSAEERRAIGESNRQHVVRRFSLDKMHMEYESLYRQVISR